MAEENVDEFAGYFNQEVTPKILITTGDIARAVCSVFILYIPINNK